MIGVEGGIFGLVQSTDEVVVLMQGFSGVEPEQPGARVDAWMNASTGA
jgi:hypothetical protein